MDVGLASTAAAGTAAATATGSDACDPATAAATADANASMLPSSKQGSESAMANALARLIEQQMQAQYEEHRKKMEVLQAKMESELLEKQAALFRALRSGSGAPCRTPPSLVGSLPCNEASGSSAYPLRSAPGAQNGGDEASASHQQKRVRDVRHSWSCDADDELSHGFAAGAAAEGAMSAPTSDADGESNASSCASHFRTSAAVAANEPEGHPGAAASSPSTSGEAGCHANSGSCWLERGDSGSGVFDRDGTTRPMVLLRLSSGSCGDGSHDDGRYGMANGNGHLGVSAPASTSRAAPEQCTQLPPPPPDELPSCDVSLPPIPDHGSSATQHDRGSSTSGGDSCSSNSGSSEDELLSQSIHLPVPAAAAAGSTSTLLTEDSKSGTNWNWLNRVPHPSGGPAVSVLTMATTSVAEAVPNGCDKEVGRPTKANASSLACADGSSGHCNSNGCQDGVAVSTVPSVQATASSHSMGNKDSHDADMTGIITSGDNYVKAARLAADELPPPLVLSDLSALRTPDDEDDLSTSLRLSLRQKHARQLANLRCYYEEEMDNLRCHMSSQEFLVTQEPYKKLLAENEQLQQRTRLLDEELARAYRYITSVDKQMSVLENTVRLITTDSKMSSNEESTELAKLRVRHTTLQKQYDELVDSHGSLQKTLRSSQEALRSSRKEQELLRVSLAQLRAEKQLLQEDLERLHRGEPKPSLWSEGSASGEPAELAERDDSASELHGSSSTDLQSSPASAGESSARQVVGKAATRVKAGVKQQHQLSADVGRASADARPSFAMPPRDAWPWSADREGVGRQFHSSTSSPSMAYFVPSSVFSDSSDKETKSEPVQDGSRGMNHLGRAARRPQPAEHSPSRPQGAAAVQGRSTDQARLCSTATIAWSAPGLCMRGPSDHGIRGTAVGGNADDEQDSQPGGEPIISTTSAATAKPSSYQSRRAEPFVAAAAVTAAGAAPQWPPSATLAVKNSHADGVTPSAGRASATTQQQQSYATPPLALSPQLPAALMQAYSPAASSSSSPAGVQRRSSGDMDASCGSHGRSSGSRRPSGERRLHHGGSISAMHTAFSGSGSGMLTSSESVLATEQQQQQQPLYNRDLPRSAAAIDAPIVTAVISSATVTVASTATSSLAPAAGAGVLSPSRDERLVMTAGTQFGKKSPGEKKAKATQTPASAADARKLQPQRKSPTRRSLQASFNVPGFGVLLAADNHRSSQADSSSSAASAERVNTWVDVTGDRNRLGATGNCSQEVRAVLSPGSTAVATSASLSEKVRLMHDLELRLDELLSEKRELEAILSRMPGSGGSVHDRLRKDEVEQQLDSVDRNLGSVRIALRRYKAL